jgi:trans-aconitate 2-methyltransferase
MNDRSSPYAFGDTPVARERLQLLGAIFDSPSRAFLARSVPRSPRLAADLGCGPGLTTRMVHEVTGAHRTVGLDQSPEFLAAAREQAPGGVEYRRWQAREPLPSDALELIYARLLLAHLPSPGELVTRWASQLSPGGRLLLDEIERIDTGNEVFREYLSMTTALVRARGAEMFAGPLLDRVRLTPADQVSDDRIAAGSAAAGITRKMRQLVLQRALTS